MSFWPSVAISDVSLMAAVFVFLQKKMEAWSCRRPFGFAVGGVRRIGIEIGIGRDLAGASGEEGTG